MEDVATIEKQAMIIAAGRPRDLVFLAEWPSNITLPAGVSTFSQRKNKKK